MNRISTSILTLCFLVITTLGYAQISVGMRGGVVRSALSVNTFGGDVEKTINPTFSVPVEIRLSKLAVIQPELNFTQMGARITQKTSSISTSGETASSIRNCKYNVNYVQMPVLMKLSPIYNKVNFSVFLGPNVNMAINGSEETLYETTTSEGAWANIEMRDLEIGGENAEIDRFNVGMIFGAGIQYQLHRSKLVLDIRHQMGLGNGGSNNPDGTISDQGTSLSFGYMFELR